VRTLGRDGGGLNMLLRWALAAAGGRVDGTMEVKYMPMISAKRMTMELLETLWSHRSLTYKGGIERGEDRQAGGARVAVERRVGRPTAGQSGRPRRARRWERCLAATTTPVRSPYPRGAHAFCSVRRKPRTEVMMMTAAGPSPPAATSGDGSPPLLQNKIPSNAAGGIGSQTT